MVERMVQVKKAKIYEDDNKRVFLCIIAFLSLSLIANVVLTWMIYGIISSQFPGRSDQFNYKHYVATKMLDYNRQLASGLNVFERSNVKKSLADFSYDIEISSSREELIQILLYHPVRVQETILQERESMIQEEVLTILNEDSGIKKVSDNTRFNLRLSSETVGMEPFNVLSASSISKINDIFFDEESGSEHILDIEVNAGEARKRVEESPDDYIQLLTEELNTLRLTLRDVRSAAGYSEMNGPGIVVKIYDQVNASESPSIVHDTDIRDLVNELFASGATGITVGGQRLIATSAIRCIGPLVNVDNKLISVNPVEIRVLGDPDLLSNGMDIIKNTLQRDRGLTFEVEKVDTITLPAYTED